MIYEHILKTVGNTPMVHLGLEELPFIDLYTKLELLNPTGSVKDRAAAYVIEKVLELGQITPRTTIIESSSGNFGIALAAYCKYRGMKFICVVDPCISPMNELLIRSFDGTIIKIETPDENGGYLLNRIRKVKQLLEEISDSYWVNQYGNPYNADAYYYTLGEEILMDLKKIDYVFLGISSGGTLTGVSRRIKAAFPNVKIIAVDIIGSVIFGHPPKKRYIPGIGSSMVPEILKKAFIDEVVMMDEMSTVSMCRELLHRFGIFAGGSSGSVFGGIKKYFSENPINNSNKPLTVVTIFPDRGERYHETVYNDQWCSKFKNTQS